MARDRLKDFLQTGTFHLFDVSATIPPVLLPIYGFSKCSAPGIHLDIHKIKEGNFEFPRKIVKGAECEPIVLERGVSLADSDFSDWVRKAITGRIAPKDLLLVQFTQVGGGVGTQVGSGFFSFDFVARLPGRAWYLKQCTPSAWKAASDFDAMTQEISITTLTLEMEEVEEFNLGI